MPVGVVEKEHDNQKNITSNPDLKRMDIDKKYCSNNVQAIIKYDTV